MYYVSCFIVTTILFGTVAGHPDRWGFIHFSRDQFELGDCLRENPDLSDFMRDHVYGGIGHYLIFKIKYAFGGKSIPETEFLPRLIDRANWVRNRRRESTDHVLWNQVIKIMNITLLECADEVTDDGQFIRPPHFVWDHNRHRLVLDYILVNWPYPRDRFMYNHARRSLFRRYARDVEYYKRSPTRIWVLLPGFSRLYVQFFGSVERIITLTVETLWNPTLNIHTVGIIRLLTW